MGGRVYILGGRVYILGGRVYIFGGRVYILGLGRKVCTLRVYRKEKVRLSMLCKVEEIGVDPMNINFIFIYLKNKNL